jgi:hypothetical protein
VRLPKTLLATMAAAALAGCPEPSRTNQPPPTPHPGPSATPAPVESATPTPVTATETPAAIFDDSCPECGRG